MSEAEEGIAARTDEGVRRGGGRFPSLRRILIYVLLLLMAFLAGFVPMWLKARSATSEREAAQRELRLSRMENSLASATFDARRGEYESARQSASGFFTALQSENDRRDDRTRSAAQQQTFERLHAQRDEIITLLARNDPASADRLQDLYAAYRDAMKSALPKATTQASPAAR